MDIRLHDSASRTLKHLDPIESGHVRLYVCGPTVYDRAYLGNARPAGVFDVLTRLLRTAFPRVTYVRNITDADNKINAQALATRRSIGEITAETTALFRQDLETLGCFPPDVEPTATSHIPEMIVLAERLVSSSHAYVPEGAHPLPGDDGSGLRHPLGARAGGLCPVEAERCRSPGLGQPLGPGTSGVAYRVLGDVLAPSRPGLRPPRERGGPALPALRERGGAVALRLPRARLRAALDA